MDTTYVSKKEGAEVGSALTIMFSNAALLKKLLSPPGDCKGLCIVSVVFLFLSLCMYAIVEVLLFILADLETRNKKLREKIKKTTDSGIEDQKTNTETQTNDRQDLPDKVKTLGGRLEQKKPDTRTLTNDERELKAKENINEQINNVILALTAIGFVTNFVISILEFIGN